MPRCLFWILLLGWTSVRAGLPELGALESLGSGRLLAVEPASGRLLLWEESALDSSAWLTPPLVVSAPGGGPEAVEQPAEVEARLGLQILVLDAGRRSLQQFSREFTPQGREALPVLESFVRPDRLALSAGRTLVLADTRAGTVVARPPGGDWSVLLDYSRAGRLELLALEVVGERVFLLEAPPRARLWLGGSEGGWWESRADSSLRVLHRTPTGGLWILFERHGRLELEEWPEAAGLTSLPDPARRLLARFALPPDNHALRDFLLLPARNSLSAPRLLLSRAGAPALLLPALEPGP